MKSAKKTKLEALGLPLSESPADVQLAWKKEIRKRMADIRAGRAKFIPAEVAMRRAYRILEINQERAKQAGSPLINTVLQRGASRAGKLRAVSTASRKNGKAVKTTKRHSAHQNTRLKPGVNENHKTEIKYIDVEMAEYVSGHKLRLTFNDATKRIVDFEPFLKRATNPMFTQYRRMSKFKSFRIDHGNLMWGDYELIFPVMDLYRGEI
ncbi:MAG: DUF2442 domain-containing protein [Verrucomicrobiota bacterium]|nr:DUF2442 domain-containing protein [Verrucomicrobiota bacterium]